MVTIDKLIAQYGKPDFIKIDVEGFESEVLDGLTGLPCPLSFEFHTAWRPALDSCLHKPCLQEAKFNSCINSRMILPRWVDRAELLASLRGPAGDIVATPLESELSE